VIRRDDDWQPATSAPGEIQTPEGRARAAGNFARSLKHRDPRDAAYRSGMLRTGLVFVGLGVLLFAGGILYAVLFG
jgi:hypothetical protein